MGWTCVGTYQLMGDRTVVAQGSPYPNKCILFPIPLNVIRELKTNSGTSLSGRSFWDHLSNLVVMVNGDFPNGTADQVLIKAGE